MSPSAANRLVHANNFGVLRLCLAATVIVGHAPEIVDGDPRREIVHRLTGQGYLGGLAVTGFFLLSGYLITQSMLRTNELRAYLVKRLLRIVPGFAVAYVATVFLLAPALGVPVGAAFRPALVNLLFLHEPPAFFAAEPHYRTINGALWTISFEFRCYLLIACLWVLGVLQRRRLVVVLTAALTAVALVLTVPAIGACFDHLADARVADLVMGTPSRLIDFSLIFLIGACAHLYRDRLLPRLSGPVAASAAVLMLPVLSIPTVGQVLFLAMAAPALFWLALKADLGRFRRINDRWDISYGVYLYGWPAAMVVVVVLPGISPWALAPLALAMALGCGAASWWLVERWFKLRGGSLFGIRLRWFATADQPAI